jgi:hypothetical protein
MYSLNVWSLGREMINVAIVFVLYVSMLSVVLMRW